LNNCPKLRGIGCFNHRWAWNVCYLDWFFLVLGGFFAPSRFLTARILLTKLAHFLRYLVEIWRRGRGREQLVLVLLCVDPLPLGFFFCVCFFLGSTRVNPGQLIWPVTRSLDRVDNRVGFQNYAIYYIWCLVYFFFIVYIHIHCFLFFFNLG
jgi:hypothetical protein